MNTTQHLTESINGLIGLRKKERENKINKVSEIFFNYLKEFNFMYFERTLIKSFFNETKPTTANLITTAILKNLTNNNKIQKGNITKTSKPFLRNRSLFCMDGGSYNLMMTKNGYNHINFYKWSYDKKTKIPRRILVDKKPIGETSLKDYDYSEIVSNKTRKNQKVLSNTQKSLTLTQQQNNKKVYFVL